MKTSQSGIELIKQFEGCKLRAYRDVVGVLTVGYGHTGDDVRLDTVLTYEGAELLLKADL
ncbi:MAG: lysozyme, partial [Burkholderiaceae bacterium]